MFTLLAQDIWIEMGQGELVSMVKMLCITIHNFKIVFPSLSVDYFT